MEDWLVEILKEEQPYITQMSFGELAEAIRKGFLSRLPRDKKSCSTYGYTTGFNEALKQVKEVI